MSRIVALSCSLWLAFLSKGGYRLQYRGYDWGLNERPKR